MFTSSPVISPKVDDRCRGFGLEALTVTSSSLIGLNVSPEFPLDDVVVSLPHPSQSLGLHIPLVLYSAFCFIEKSLYCSNVYPSGIKPWSLDQL